MISIESSEIILNLRQSESFEKFPMLLLSYISDKDLEELSKGLGSESEFCESFFVMDYFGVGNQISFFLPISFIVGDYLSVGLAIEIMKNPNIW